MAVKPKKVPIRRCIGCGEGKPKKELVRVVRNANGDISIDITGRKPGRGAYICYQAQCLEKAKKRRSLERAFSTKISEDVYAELQAQIQEATTHE